MSTMPTPDQSTPDQPTPDQPTPDQPTTEEPTSDQSIPEHFRRPEPRISEFNRPVVEEFRANGGRVGGLFEGGDLLLLTTEGASSGVEHTTPLAYVRVDDRLLVVGSAGGSPRHPDWYHNLLARPMVRVEIGTDAFEAVAVPAEGADRDRLFQHIVDQQPGFADYQAQVERRLPVVELQRSQIDVAPDVAAGFAGKLIEVHTWLRTQLKHVRAESEAFFTASRAAEGGHRPPVGLSLQIRQHCLAFCQSLEFHHTGEDVVMFPDLVRQFPDLGDPIERLRAEHHVVSRIRAELEALLADMATADPDSFRAELNRMSGELEAHLDYEEAVLIPVLAALPTPGAPQRGETA